MIAVGAKNTLHRRKLSRFWLPCKWLNRRTAQYPHPLLNHSSGTCIRKTNRARASCLVGLLEMECMEYYCCAPCIHCTDIEVDPGLTSSWGTGSSGPRPLNITEQEVIIIGQVDCLKVPDKCTNKDSGTANLWGGNDVCLTKQKPLINSHLGQVECKWKLESVKWRYFGELQSKTVQEMQRKVSGGICVVF